jgi:hypothetical protein
VDEAHRRLAEIALRAAAKYGFALAGGYAVQAHGISQRPSEDVDLFAAWERRGDFAAAVDVVSDAFATAGYKVHVAQQFETSARLAVTEPGGSGPLKVELAANWRARQPVQLDIGPVLHLDDVAIGKMSALYTRAEPRDFIDVDALVRSGRYSGDDLCRLEAAADDGFTTGVLAEVFMLLSHYPDRRFTAYGLAETEVAELRNRFDEWRRQLTDAAESP